MRERFATVALRLFDRGTLAYLRDDLHFWLVRMSNLLSLQSRRTARRAARSGRPLFLNLGCGPRALASRHWINVDGTAARGVDFAMDFRRRLPFPGDCFDGIFTEHVLEHFSYEDGISLLRECRRVLRPGGAIRIIVPDGEFILRSYFEQPAELMRRRACRCAMEAVNLYFRQGHEHRCLHDCALLNRQLEAAGFRQVSRSGFGQSRVAALALDDGKYQWESLYIEAVKTEAEADQGERLTSLATPENDRLP